MSSTEDKKSTIEKIKTGFLITLAVIAGLFIALFTVLMIKNKEAFGITPFNILEWATVVLQVSLVT